MAKSKRTTPKKKKGKKVAKVPDVFDLDSAINEKRELSSRYKFLYMGREWTPVPAINPFSDDFDILSFDSEGGASVRADSTLEQLTDLLNFLIGDEQGAEFIELARNDVNFDIAPFQKLIEWLVGAIMGASEDSP